MSPLAQTVLPYVLKIQRPKVENEWPNKKPKD